MGAPGEPLKPTGSESGPESRAGVEKLSDQWVNQKGEELRFFLGYTVYAATVSAAMGAAVMGLIAMTGIGVAGPAEIAGGAVAGVVFAVHEINWAVRFARRHNPFRRHRA